MVVQERHTLGIQFVDAARAIAAVTDEPGVLQHAQMLRDGRAGHGQPGGKLVHRAGMSAEHFEDGQAGGVAQGREAVLYVSIHLR